jgi:hypothetical protein
MTIATDNPSRPDLSVVVTIVIEVSYHYER